MSGPLYGQLGPLTRRRPATGFTLSGLVSSWRMDEASGIRYDSVGTNHLTDTNSTPSATGIIGNAASFNGSTAYRLSIASNATLEYNGSFGIACWVYVNALSNAVIITKLNPDGTGEWRLQISLGGVLTFSVWRAAAQQAFAQSSAVSAGGWLFVAGWFDTADNRCRLSVNNGTVATSGVAANVPEPVSAVDLSIGCYSTGASRLNGLVDAVVFRLGAFTSPELTELYNGGVGVQL